MSTVSRNRGAEIAGCFGYDGPIAGGFTMPLTKKGKKIKAAMAKTYGEEQGERVFYASKNKGAIKGVEGKKRKNGGRAPKSKAT
jgi:hypothetical protein